MRIDTRLLVGADEKGGLYVLEVVLAGKRLGWFQEKGKLSKSWTHSEHGVCRRERLNIDVAEGTHEVVVRLVAADSDFCLLRVSHKEPPEPED